MNIHLMTKETHPTAGYENVYTNEYTPEEYVEVFTEADRQVLNVGMVRTRDLPNGWKARTVRMDILALQAIGRAK